MLVPMMQIGQVRMSVRHRGMLVPMRVRLGSLAAAMRVLVMLVVDVPMAVGEILVGMLVRVLLGQYQPGRGNHQCQRDAK